MEDKDAFLAEIFNEDLYLILKDDTSLKPVDVVSPTIIQEASPQTSLEVIPFLGKNQNGVLILLSNQGDKICTQDNLEFLGKIFKAIKLSSNDVALINVDHFIEGKHKLPEFKQIISFDVIEFLKSKSIPVPQNKYVVNLSDKAFLWADSVENMQADINMKKQFWGALQQMFL